MSLSLNDRLRAIGFRIAGGAIRQVSLLDEVDLEKTLLEAVLEFPRDARLFSLTFTWIKRHGAYVIVEKFAKLAAACDQNVHPAVCWAAALAAFASAHGNHKWRKLVRPMPEPVYLYPPAVTSSAITRKGAIPWLQDLNFRVPEGSLRLREDDVLSPEELIRLNPQYRNRYLYGPSWRADIITAIEGGMRTPTEIARRLGCSYEPAWRVFHDYTLAMAGAQGGGRRQSAIM